MPKVSIIIPFNNVEDYMEECLKSVVNQTLNDIEIILINDASKDNSRQIAQNYANNDSRIKIIDIDTQKGQGYARNRGIETVQGEYIGFVDSDDFIEPYMFELLYNSAKENNTDITMCQAREYDDLNNKYITSDYYSLVPLGSFKDEVFSAEDTKTNILDINVALWNKIYKKDFLLSTGEMFPEGFIYEDLPFFFGTYLKAKRINIVWKNLYCYRINRKNSTMQQYNNKILDRPPMVSLTYEKIKSFPFLNDLNMQIQGWIINDLFHRYSLMKENLHREFFFLMKKVFKNLNIEDINDDYWKKVYHFQGYLLVINNSFEEFNKKVFNEYLDIHKVEDRLLSQISNKTEIDSRFNAIYEDLHKNYDYTEDLVKKKAEIINSEIQKTYDYTNNIINNKVENIYSDIQKTYDYTNNLVNNKVENIYSDIQKTYDYTNNLVNNKVEDIYSDIQKTYDYTEDLVNKTNCSLNNNIKEISEHLYNDIKDLSYVQKDNFIELNKEQFKITEQITNLSNKINIDNEKNKEEIIKSKEEYKQFLNNKTEDIKNIILQNDNIYKKDINSLKLKIDTEKQNTISEINKLKEEYEERFKLQEQKHQEEIEIFNKKMIEMQDKLREEMKSPLKKFIEKHQKKSEK